MPMASSSKYSPNCQYHSCILLLLLPSLSLLLLLPCAESKLTLDYYSKTCPRFLEIVQRVITDKQISTPTTAAAALRIFFHDCMVEGCDASVLISSNSFNTAERTSDINLSLPGDGFDVIIRAKTAIELECPGVVSCSDILAVATRDLVVMVGGPFYEIVLGRKDSLASKISNVEGNIARPNMSITQLISMFEAKGLSVQDLVALSGAHTIGFSHCSQFAKRIYNFSKSSQIDPTINPKYAQGLRKHCENYTKNDAISAYNDVMTPGKFDNMYFQNLQKGLGLLATDQALASDPRTKQWVDAYAANQTAFFKDFARAIEKVSVMNVKTEKNGEVRHRCDVFNSLNSNQKA
ncbi:peroxidase 31-like [Diospyros lotus]|uniref:peroxidase 31-like n=1 Tax=Diospyros lotus TaxID=55363 RepID=UPI0022527549|nr:peroxidase 31-like [Diospyros lotus]